jgi:hypothetical protein
MSSFPRSSTAFRRVFARIILAAALVALLGPCLDAIDAVAMRIADNALYRASSRSAGLYAGTSREANEVRGAAENGADGAGAEDIPECRGCEERAEVDDVDERRRSWCVDSAVLTSVPDKLLTEESVLLRTEDRRRKRPPNLRA